MIANRQIMRAAVLALALASLAACASKPTKPAPSMGLSPREAYTAPASPGGGPVSSGPEAPIPGSERDFVINAGDRIYFDLDQYAVRPDAAPVLEAQAAWLNRYRAVRIRIEGNCDERGSREYNVGLGERRANAIAQALEAQGVSPSQVSVVSYGKEKPVCSEHKETCFSQNRRGDLVAQ